MEAGSQHPGPVRHRAEPGVEFSRIVSFTDGVFSIAITLLVLTLQMWIVLFVVGGRASHFLWRHGAQGY